MANSGITGRAADLASAISSRARTGVSHAHDHLSSGVQSLAQHRRGWILGLIVAVVIVVASIWTLVVLQKPKNRERKGNNVLSILQGTTLVAGGALLTAALVLLFGHGATKA